MATLLKRIRRRLNMLAESSLSNGQFSYSQFGEDILVARILEQMDIKQPRYLDIGTNHPVRCNNTYFFYRRGSCGVCVEPNQVLAAEIRRMRPKDVCIAAGVTASEGSQQTFYEFDNPGVSTFSSEHAEFVEANSPFKLVRTVAISVITMDQLLERCVNADFVSLDCEGLDLSLLEEVDFERFRPAVVCVETSRPGPATAGVLRGKIQEIPALMRSNGYWPMADSYVNTIFVDEQRLRLG